MYGYGGGCFRLGVGSIWLRYSYWLKDVGWKRLKSPNRSREEHVRYAHKTELSSHVSMLSPSGDITCTAEMEQGMQCENHMHTAGDQDASDGGSGW